MNFLTHPPNPSLGWNYLIPRPLLPGEKGRKNNIIRVLSPSLLGDGFRERLKDM